MKLFTKFPSLFTIDQIIVNNWGQKGQKSIN